MSSKHPEKKRSDSISKAQSNAELSAINKLSSSLFSKKIKIEKKKLKFGEYYFEPDGYAEDGNTIYILEVNSRIGPPKNGTFNKFFKDSYKLITIRKLLQEKRKNQKVILYLVFVDEESRKYFDLNQTRSWAALSIQEWSINLVTVELTEAEREAIKKAQIKQDLTLG